MTPKRPFEINWPLRAYCPNIYTYCIFPSSVFLERQRPFWCCVGLMANFDKQMSTWRRDPEKSEFLANKVTCPFCRGRKNCCENCCVFLGSNLSSYLGGEGEKDVFCTKLGQGFTHAQDFLECHICCEDGCSMCILFDKLTPKNSIWYHIFIVEKNMYCVF